jgi:tetratricopeptide (TPR) repeat protein
MTAATLDQEVSVALRDAVLAAQRGESAVARKIAEAALRTSGDSVALNAFLGMLHMRSEKWSAAAANLTIAHRGSPADATIACNLISAHIEAGSLDSALEVASRELSFADPSLRICRYRAYLALMLERFDDAIESYRFIVERAPQDFESWNNLGNALCAVDIMDEAVAALEAAIAIDPDARPTLLNLASALSAAGRPGQAISILRSGLVKFPDDARLWHHLHPLLKADNRNDEALEAAEAAVRCDPRNAAYLVSLGVEYGHATRLEDAERAYRRAIEADPATQDAYLGLAIQFEHSNREDELATLADLGNTNGVDDGCLAFIRALDCRRKRQFGEGLAYLASVPSSVEPERTAHLRGVLLDRLGKSADAFAQFEQANNMHALDSSDPIGRAKVYRDEIRGEIAMLSAEWAASLNVVRETQQRSDPVFLVGFPRSGTTLLDTFLMGHPATRVMEEKPVLNYIDSELGGMKGLLGLDPAAAVQARARYLQESDVLVPATPGSILIDKSPLFLMKIPLIYSLFPNARFILALRHPCDVLLSCFMSNFRLNSAMSNFLRLEDAAEFYDLTFRHWETASFLFPINVHTVVYEKLVANPEAELRPLFDFLGLDWQATALNHTETARRRGLITTASYSQVAEPVYDRAAGRWQHYKSFLEPVLPTLEPFVRKFGYSL